MSVPEGAGKRFLEKFPKKEEWPDLEDEKDQGDVVQDSHQKEMAMKETATAGRDVTQKPVEGTDAEEKRVVEKWELDIDASWSKRVNTPGESIHGSVAAVDAAKVLGVDKLKESPYKTLKSLIKGSQYLGTKWSYNENRIIRG